MKISTASLIGMVLCSTSFGSLSDDLYEQWYQQGLEQIQQENLEGAKNSFEQALEHKPNDPDAQKGVRMAEERLAKEEVAPVVQAPVKTVKKKNSKDFSIRVSLGSTPGIDEGEVDGLGTLSIEDETGGQLEILVVKRFWSKNNPNLGGILGGGVFLSSNSGSDQTPPVFDYDLTALGIMGQGGVAARFGDYVVVEVMPYFGIGGASVEITSFSDGGAPYFIYGIKGGVFVLLGESIELGLELGYHGFSSEVELDFGGGVTTDLTLSGSGVRGALVAAIKF